MEKSIAVGIPFMASHHTKALELCLLSIKRYLPQATEVFLQLDVTNKELYETFRKEPLLNIVPDIRIRYYTRSRSGDYKQALIEWVVSEAESAYAIIMHSDVFFWKPDIYRILIEPLIARSGLMFCCWKTPFTEYHSTFHISPQSERRFWVAPRIATWLFSLNINECKICDPEFSLFWKGHYWIRKGIVGDIPVDRNRFMNWMENDGIDAEIASGERDCLIDIGTFFRMYWDEGKICGKCLGTLGNPSFTSMDFFYHREGFVHIEQYDPERFDDRFYKTDTLKERTALVEEVLQREYGRK